MQKPEWLQHEVKAYEKYMTTPLSPEQQAEQMAQIAAEQLEAEGQLVRVANEQTREERIGEARRSILRMCSGIIKERDSLRTQNEELRKDKERLDWLQKERPCTMLDALQQFDSESADIRTAIDNAREGK